MECTVKRPPWGTAHILRPGDRDRIDLEDGLPPALAPGRRLRRFPDVEVPRFAGGGGPFHLVIDATGLKILGDGEWQSHKHKTSNQRRSWRKLHLGIDEDGFIINAALTDRIADDACIAISLLEQIEGGIARFTADGAYDSRPR